MASNHWTKICAVTFLAPFCLWISPQALASDQRHVVVVVWDGMRPDFVTEELPPWEENGETWRPLSVLFPREIASHTQRQISYFGPDGLLRRHEYTVDVLGGAKGLNYAMEYRNVDGISVPMKRRVYAYDVAKRQIPEPVLVAIDINDIAFN